MSVRKSLLISLSQSYVLLALSFVASLVIARLLTPRELGIFSVAMVLIGIINTLRDFGVVSYLVQEKELTRDRIRAAMTVTYASAWAMAALVWLGADAAATFYGEPGVAQVMNLLAINLALLPFGSTIMAFMRREMMFERIALIRVAIAFTQTSASILLAWQGLSYLSMAWAAVIASIVRIVLVRVMQPSGLPPFPGIKEIRRVLGFSTLSSLANVLREGGRGAPDLVLGKTLGMDSVAFFSRAAGLVETFNRFIVEAIAFVALPHFSARARKGEDVSGDFLQGMTYLTGLCWPFFIFLAVCAQPVVLLLYGDQWHDSVTPLRFLCLGEMLIAPFYLQPQLLIARGRIGLETLRTGLTIGIRLIPLLLLTDMGLNMIAAGYALSSLAVAGISAMILHTSMDISLARIFHALRPSIVVLVACGASAALTALGISALGGGDVALLTCMAVVMPVSSLIAMRAASHPLMRELAKVTQRFRDRRTP
jgi:O-antigen/teichoic acid export membrane protein